MKRTLSLILFIVLILSSVTSQSPFFFNYQAVIRDLNGLPQLNKDISMKMSILQYSPDGIISYVESFKLKTNEFGLVNLEIGNGVKQTGSIADIDWNDGPYFLETAIDSAGGEDYLILGTSQLLSVPFALHARTVEIDNVNDGDISPYNEIQSLSLNNNTLSIENGNSVEINTLSPWDINGNDIFYNAGNVGIGTSMPSTLLNIEGTSEYTEGRTLFTLKNNSTDTHSSTAIKLFAGLNSSSSLTISHHSSSYSVFPDHDNASLIWNRGTALALRSTGSNASIRFQTSSVESIIERMRIDEYGNLGIGTPNPKSKVHIANGDIYLESYQSSIIMKSPNGQCWQMKVNNNGNPEFTPINCP